jgi:hypothetical protein
VPRLPAGLWDVRIPSGARHFSLQNFQSVSAARPARYSVGVRPFPGAKAARTRGSPLTPIQSRYNSTLPYAVYKDKFAFRWYQNNLCCCQALGHYILRFSPSWFPTRSGNNQSWCHAKYSVTVMTSDASRITRQYEHCSCFIHIRETQCCLCITENICN